MDSHQEQTVEKKKFINNSFDKEHIVYYSKGNIEEIYFPMNIDQEMMKNDIVSDKINAVNKVSEDYISLFRSIYNMKEHTTIVVGSFKFFEYQHNSIHMILIYNIEKCLDNEVKSLYSYLETMLIELRIRTNIMNAKQINYEFLNIKYINFFISFKRLCETFEKCNYLNNIYIRFNNIILNMSKILKKYNIEKLFVTNMTEFLAEPILFEYDISTESNISKKNILDLKLKIVEKSYKIEYKIKSILYKKDYSEEDPEIKKTLSYESMYYSSGLID